MSPNFKLQKVQRKVSRCLALIEKECQVLHSDQATNILAILNAGLSTGLTEEAVLNAAAPHGKVSQLIMLKNKSYCFIKCSSVSAATTIYAALHNKAHLGQDEAVIYMQYFENAPQVDNDWLKPPPAGLLILPDFVTPAEEQLLLAAVGSNVAEPISEHTKEKQLKHRKVRHFGYEFLYGSNNIDPDHPLASGIPAACNALWPRAKQQLAQKALTFDWQTPDQLTVNEYEPGQGIPPHVDTHSAFLDPILVISLEAAVVMEFRRLNERVPVLLPQRSLLVMSAAARYDWMHGITQRLMDVVPGDNGALTTKLRGKRTSLTFRRLRRAPCACQFPALCDTRLAQKSTPTLDAVAVDLELNNVHKVYEQISSHFSETRHTPWAQVAAFINSFETGQVVLDVGCGNGKYLRVRQDILMLGCDRSAGLLQVCGEQQAQVFRCDCLQLPIASESVDGAISIAVIHHLASRERRLTAIREMARVLKTNGRALIYVWAKEQRANEKKSSYLLQNKAINKHKTTEELQRQETAKLQSEHIDMPISLPIHTNRTDFQQQDVYVPWKLKNEKATTFLRYYHVFESGELEALVQQIEEVEILQSYYDQGNHCIIFSKKRHC